MKMNVTVANKENTCIHNLSLKLRSGVTVINVKPLFSYDSQNVIIASGTDIRVFGVKSGECTVVMKYHSRPVIGLQENRRNMLQIFSCSDDGVVVRWDYSGRILQVCDLQMPVVCFYAPSISEEWFITKKFEDEFRLYSVIGKKKGCSKVHLIQKPVLPKENAVAFGLEDKYVACIYKNKLTLYKFDSKSIIRHMTGERNLTCVVCHPSEYVLATGDEHGRIIVWSNALNSNHPIRSIYHWHTLPVADLAFSPEGSHIHSGGGESALVKWNLFSEEKMVLPRLGAPIERVITSKDNAYAMTTHADNVLQVIDAQRNIVQVIQGLTKSQPLYEKILPVGLMYNKQLKCLVMNGKPGHLQFFDLKTDKLMFNLDIASKNFMSQDRDIAIYNIDVQKAALDDTGLWLATTEYWCNSDVSPQIWLKFWQFDMEKQTFTLNTNVYLPHNKELNDLQFRNVSKHSEDPALAVTTSNDCRFKIWVLNTIPNEKKQSWGCQFMGYYRNMIPTSTCFSEDGTVLAVAFGRVATLWRTKNLALKASLFNKKNERDIKQLLFGCHAGFKYLICHDGFSITSWDCVSFSIAWIVHYEIQLLVADIASDNIAAFCKDQNLKVFKANSPQPLDCIKKVSSSPIVCAVFVPSDSGNNISGCFSEKSQLYFMDETQNLFSVLEAETEEEVTPSQKRSIFQNISETPFGMLQATQIISDIKAVEIEQFAISQKKEENNIIPNPTWQDPQTLLKAILPKLLMRKEEELKKTKPSKPLESCNEKDSDDDTIQITFDEQWMSTGLSNIEAKVLDFSFLMNLNLTV